MINGHTDWQEILYTPVWSHLSVTLSKCLNACQPHRCFLPCRTDSLLGCHHLHLQLAHTTVTSAKYFQTSLKNTLCILSSASMVPIQSWDQQWTGHCLIESDMAIDTEIAKVVTRPQKASDVFKIPRSTIFQLSTDYPVTDFLKVQNVH